MLLLDRAIKLAAEQDEPDEMNFVRKHAKQQVRSVRHAEGQRQLPAKQLCLARMASIYYICLSRMSGVPFMLPSAPTSLFTVCLHGKRCMKCFLLVMLASCVRHNPNRALASVSVHKIMQQKQFPLNWSAPLLM
jgi:hypothetical protein